MLAFRDGAESWLGASAYCTGDWRPQRLVSELELDLRDLGLTSIHNGFIAWRAESESFAMGVHYVLEGSALGARILCQRVEPLGLGREYGARHLWAQAEHPHNFRGFLDLLSARSNELNESHVIAGANAAFSAAARAMECARA